MRVLGMGRKLAFGRWFEWGYRVLVALRRLRGTPLDLFGVRQSAARGAGAC